MYLQTKLLGRDYAADIRLQNNGPLVVTFDNLGSAGALHGRSGWGAEYLESKGYNVIAFMEGRPEAWFRAPAFRELIDEVKATVDLAGFPERIGYGVSMGAYAAGAYSHLLDLDRLILFAPISTLNAELAPFDARFPLARGQNWQTDCHDAAQEIARRPRQVIVCADPLNGADHRHKDRIAARSADVRFYPVAGGGHLLVKTLQELGHLDWVVSQLLQGAPPSPAAFARRLRNRRDTIGYFKAMLSTANPHLTPRRRRVLERRLVKLALRDHGWSPTTLAKIAEATRRGRKDAARLVRRHGLV